jgi:hypothetical protein
MAALSLEAHQAPLPTMTAILTHAYLGVQVEVKG